MIVVRDGAEVAVPVLAKPEATPLPLSRRDPGPWSRQAESADRAMAAVAKHC